MAARRTPDDRFQELAGYPFEPHYLDDLPGFEELRLHYLDEGPTDANRVALCLHGQPTWSFLYRRMLPVFVEAGLRVVAPDLFGFGRSDKPTEDATYTFDFHRRSLLTLVDRLDLRRVTLVVHDWGGILGLTLPMEMPRRFERLLVMNTAIATGDAALPDGFLAWRAWCSERPDLEVGQLMGRSCPHLSQTERAAYDAPFPDASFKGGIRRFPQLVPEKPDDPGAALSRRARGWWRTEWRGPTFMAVGMQDPVLGPPVMAALRRALPGCPPPLELPEAGHFVPEWGEPVARASLEAFEQAGTE